MTVVEGWDWWSEVKLQILRDYLQAFTRVVRSKSSQAIYLDLFAGSYENQRRHEPGTFAGSSQIALNIDPPFTRLVFCELDGPAQDLRADIEAAWPKDSRWRVVEGDSNATLRFSLPSTPSGGRRPSRFSIRRAYKWRGVPSKRWRDGELTRRRR